ncbi:hypothetical protein AVEN_55677-1 [Araneus ventricosus]|uniref:Peptidase aspartic putative domain-containing protein n=1 Tax=Araneus ventricosus TaxID=182803 RepID=A0A4Y2IYL4_ARAVE|nr:hypothetical protein AVEN_55677-1 [Araneus ventricosus]
MRVRDFDSASSRSYKDRVVNCLTIIPLCDMWEEVIHGLSGGKETPPIEYGIYTVEINDLNGSFIYCCEVFSKLKICGFVPKIEDPQILENLRVNNIELSDVTCNKNEIDLLIGADLIGKLLTGRCVQLKFGSAAIHIKLGWIVIGKETGLYSSDDYTVMDSVQTVLSLHVNNASLRELWNIEFLGIREPIENVSKRKAFVEQLREFHEKLTVLPNGRYEVELPWKLDARANLPDNKELALKRQENDKLRARNKWMACFCFVFCMLILCFINNCNKNSVSKSSKLILSGMESAEIVLIRLIQSQYFSNAKAVPSVDVFKDENGILRGETRITERKDVQTFLNLILLPNNCALTKRLIEPVHRKHRHAGTQIMLSILREKFWILEFNPPTASWWGGFWERLVRVIKELLRRSLGKIDLIL